MAFWVPWERRLFERGRAPLTQNFEKACGGKGGKGEVDENFRYERKRDLPHCGSPRRRMILVIDLSI